MPATLYRNLKIAVTPLQRLLQRTLNYCVFFTLTDVLNRKGDGNFTSCRTFLVQLRHGNFLAHPELFCSCNWSWLWAERFFEEPSSKRYL